MSTPMISVRFLLLAIIALISLSFPTPSIADTVSEYSPRDLIAAIDAALIRVLASGDFMKSQLRYPPFEVVSSLSCFPVPSQFPFPAADSATGLLKKVVTKGILRVGGIKFKVIPDGDYTVDPPTGFLPDLLDDVVRQLSLQYGQINITRVYYPSSDGSLLGLNRDEADMTDFYYVFPGSFNNTVPRVYNYPTSCSALGYASSFITLKSNGASNLKALHKSISDMAPTIATLGTISAGDFDAIRPVMPSNVKAMVYSSTDALLDALRAGNITAAILSGAPPASAVLDCNVFKSTIIAPRAAMFRQEPFPAVLDNKKVICQDPTKSNVHTSAKKTHTNFSPLATPFGFPYTDPNRFSDFAKAFNAAIVRVINADKIVDLQVQNPPFRTSTSMTCSPLPTVFTFPSRSSATGALARILSQSKIRMAHIPSLLRSNAEAAFWQAVMNLVVQQFNTAYAATFTLETVSYATLDAALFALDDQSVDMTAPYLRLGGTYLNEKSIRSAFTLSCSLAGYTPQIVIESQWNLTSGLKLFSALDHNNHDIWSGYPVQNGKLPFGFLRSDDAFYLNSVLPPNKIYPVVSNDINDLAKAIRNGTIFAALWTVPETLPASLLSDDLTIIGSTVVSPHVAFFKAPLYDLCDAPNTYTSSSTGAAGGVTSSTAGASGVQQSSTGGAISAAINVSFSVHTIIVSTILAIVFAMKH